MNRIQIDGTRSKSKMTVPGKRTTTKTTNAISEESAIDLEVQIRCRAYELYERRGREAGHETEDWLQAEAELARERTMPLQPRRSKAIVNGRSQRAEKAPLSRLKKSRSSTPNRTERE